MCWWLCCNEKLQCCRLGPSHAAEVSQASSLNHGCRGALMKIFAQLVISFALFSPSINTLAQDPSTSSTKPGVISALVTVNKQGKVTDVSTPMPLAPAFDRLLRQNISELIAAPAHKDGKPITSQLVLKMSLDTTQRPDGNYDTKFIAIDSQSIPSGTWYWRLTDGNRYVLVDRNNLQQNYQMPAAEVRTPPPSMMRSVNTSSPAR